MIKKMKNKIESYFVKRKKRRMLKQSNADIFINQISQEIQQEMDLRNRELSSKENNTK